mgnify:CR=1 FL=1
MRASEVIGARVTDRSGQQLGRVTDLLIDDSAPRNVCYALLDIHQGSDAVQHIVAVPWSLVEPGGEDRQLVLGVSRRALRRLRRN